MDTHGKFLGAPSLSYYLLYISQAQIIGSVRQGETAGALTRSQGHTCWVCAEREEVEGGQVREEGGKTRKGRKLTKAELSSQLPLEVTEA